MVATVVADEIGIHGYFHLINDDGIDEGELLGYLLAVRGVIAEACPRADQVREVGSDEDGVGMDSGGCREEDKQGKLNGKAHRNLLRLEGGTTGPSGTDLRIFGEESRTLTVNL